MGYHLKTRMALVKMLLWSSTSLSRSVYSSLQPAFFCSKHYILQHRVSCVCQPLSCGGCFPLACPKTLETRVPTAPWAISSIGSELYFCAPQSKMTVRKWEEITAASFCILTNQFSTTKISVFVCFVPKRLRIYKNRACPSILNPMYAYSYCTKKVLSRRYVSF